MTDATTAELTRLSTAFVDALREACGLARAGEYGGPLRDVVAFCLDLFTITDETLAAAPQAGEYARGLAKHMAEQLAALETLLGPVAGA